MDRVEFEPADDVLDAQLYLIQTMLLKENLMCNDETVEYGEVLRLRRLLVAESEPEFVGRKMVLQQGALNFSFGASEDPWKGIDRRIDRDTRMGFSLSALANGSELENKFGDHLVLHAYRVESFSEMEREIRDDLRSGSLLEKRKWWPWAASEENRKATSKVNSLHNSMVSASCVARQAIESKNVGGMKRNLRNPPSPSNSGKASLARMAKA